MTVSKELLLLLFTPFPLKPLGLCLNSTFGTLATLHVKDKDSKLIVIGYFHVIGIVHTLPLAPFF